MSRHRGGDDEAAGSALLEVGTDGLRAVEGTVQVGLDNLVPRLHAALEDAAVCGTAGVGDEGVDLAEVLDHVADEGRYALPVADVALVGLDLDPVLLRQLLSVLVASIGARCVGDGQVGSHLGAATGSFDTHSSRSGGTGDDNDLALKAEEVGEGIGFGD